MMRWLSSGPRPVTVVTLILGNFFLKRFAKHRLESAGDVEHQCAFVFRRFDGLVPLRLPAGFRIGGADDIVR